MIGKVQKPQQQKDRAPKMNAEAGFRYSYLQGVYEDTLDDWKDNPTTENTLKLGWSIAELEGGLRNVNATAEPVYPNAFFHHLLTMDGQTLCALPADMVEVAIKLEPSMLRHYGLTRPNPAAIFKELSSGGGTTYVTYFGNDL